MSRAVIIAAAVMPLFAIGQFGAANDTEQVTVTSTNVIERAWKRDVVMVTPSGYFVNDSGRVGSAADTAAIDTAAREAQGIANAANTAMTNALQMLYAATNSMARTAQGYALAFLPSTDRDTLTMAVIDESTDGTNDTQWVYISHTLELKPNRYVAYEYYGGAVTQKVTWVNWTSNGVSRVVNGQTWSGVHQCTIARPPFAVGVTCLTNPNDKLGGASGVDFGDLVLTLGGGQTQAYTGFVTNTTDGVVAYFDNGFLKGIEEIGAAE